MQPTPAAAQHPRPYANRNFRIVLLATLIAVLAVSSITPALGSIKNALGLDDLSVGLLITAFTLPGIVTPPLFGIAADRLGRKQVIVPSLFLFGITGTAMFFVSDFSLLLVLRFIQGIFGGSMGTLAMIVIADIFSGRELVDAMGINASVLNVGAIAYPVIGGLLVGIGWNYPFLLPILALPVGVIILVFLDAPAPQSSEGLQTYVRNAFQYFRKRDTLLIFASGIFMFVLAYGAFLTYLSLYLSDHFGASGAEIGLVFVSMSLAVIAVSSQLPRIPKTIRKKTLIQIGFALYALSFVLIPFIDSLWLMALPAMLFGLGQGINFPNLQSALAEMAPAEYRAVFMSANTSMLRLGQTIGPIAVILLADLLGHAGMYLLLAGLCAAAVTGAFFVRHDG